MTTSSMERGPVATAVVDELAQLLHDATTPLSTTEDSKEAHV